jgi:hypothetical protein
MLKIRNFASGRGKNVRGTGMHFSVHEEAEDIFNDAMKQKGDF